MILQKVKRMMSRYLKTEWTAYIFWSTSDAHSWWLNLVSTHAVQIRRKKRTKTYLSVQCHRKHTWPLINKSKSSVHMSIRIHHSLCKRYKILKNTTMYYKEIYRDIAFQQKSHVFIYVYFFLFTSYFVLYLRRDQVIFAYLNVKALDLWPLWYRQITPFDSEDLHYKRSITTNIFNN